MQIPNINYHLTVFNIFILFRTYRLKRENLQVTPMPNIQFQLGWGVGVGVGVLVGVGFKRVLEARASL